MVRSDDQNSGQLEDESNSHPKADLSSIIDLPDWLEKMNDKFADKAEPEFALHATALQWALKLVLEKSSKDNVKNLKQILKTQELSNG